MNSELMTHKVLCGVLPVLNTPFNEDFSIDWETLAREIDWVYDCGANGIVLAMVSETLRLTQDERDEMAAFLVRENANRGSVTISVGAESTFAATRFARHAASVGADALMAIPPISVALDEAQLRGYYAAIIEAVEIPVVVQDASAYVGRPLSAQFQAALWREWGERVAFKPEAAPVGPVISTLREMTNGQAQIFEGSGGTQLVENFRRGVAGTMPGVDLLDAIVALWRALEAGDEARIYQLSPLIGSILALGVGLDGYLAVEKHLLHKRGLFKNTLVRGPVGFTLDAATVEELDRVFARLQSTL